MYIHSKKDDSLIEKFRRHDIYLSYLSVPNRTPNWANAPANIMSSGPHNYFGRSLCTTGDDATVRRHSSMYLYILANLQVSGVASSALIPWTNATERI